MQHLKYWPRALPQNQKKTYCPVCGELTAHDISTTTGACRIVCSADKTHWASEWGEKTWEGRIIGA